MKLNIFNIVSIAILAMIFLSVGLFGNQGNSVKKELPCESISVDLNTPQKGDILVINWDKCEAIIKNVDNL